MVIWKSVSLEPLLLLVVGCLTIQYLLWDLNQSPRKRRNEPTTCIPGGQREPCNGSSCSQTPARRFPPSGPCPVAADGRFDHRALLRRHPHSPSCSRHAFPASSAGIAPLSAWSRALPPR